MAKTKTAKSKTKKSTKVKAPKTEKTNALTQRLRTCRALLEGHSDYPLSFDLFRKNIALSGEPITDYDINRIRFWFIETNEIQITVQDTRAMVKSVARQKSFHPIRDWLDSLPKPDGPPILDNYLEVLGCRSLLHDQRSKEDQEKHRKYMNTVARQFLISSVARVRQPGCQVDSGLILFNSIGGRFKSVLFRKLFNNIDGKNYLHESGIKDIANPQSIVQDSSGHWCELLDEDSSITRTDQASLKKFFTTTIDSATLKWEKFATPYPRQFVIGGTTNKKELFLSEGGLRRFHVFDMSGCTPDKMEWLARNRDRLFAEADTAYQAGECWYIDEHKDPELFKVMTEEHQEIIYEQPWQGVLKEFLESWIEPPRKNSKTEKEETVVRSSVLIDHILEKLHRHPGTRAFSDYMEKRLGCIHKRTANFNGWDIYPWQEQNKNNLERLEQQQQLEETKKAEQFQMRLPDDNGLMQELDNDIITAFNNGGTRLVQ